MQKHFCEHCGKQEGNSVWRRYCDWCGCEMPKDPLDFLPRINLPPPKAKQAEEDGWQIEAILPLQARELYSDGRLGGNLDICLDCMLRAVKETKKKEGKW